MNCSSKISRWVNTLSQHTVKSNMVSQHAAGIISGGKILSIGYNHDRMCTNGKFILSYHAETHALTQYIDTNNLSHLKNFMNDTTKALSFRRGGKNALVRKGRRKIKMS